MVDLTYVPLNDVIPKIEAPTKIDIPQYPDKGVEFAGFSKTIYSGNQYQLNPQTEDDQSFLYHYTGAATSTTITNPWGGKDFYCTKIFIQTFISGAMIGGQYFVVTDGSMTKFAALEDGSHGMHEFNIDFKVPIKFTKGNNPRIVYSAARAAGDYTLISFYGWTE